MQTFLPYPDFGSSASVLDYRRLGKQRLEARQILKTLEVGGGWENHPAVRMWRGYEEALSLYYNMILAEWEDRGYKNNMKYVAMSEQVKLLDDFPDLFPEFYPPWFGDMNFHRSHRSNLLRKDPEWYSQYHWYVPDDLPYVWPV